MRGVSETGIYSNGTCIKHTNHIDFQYRIVSYMSGGENYLLVAMDMAKVGGPLSLVKVCTSVLSVKVGYQSWVAPYRL